MAEDFDALRTAAYDEYDADIAKLQANFDSSVQRAEDSLANGGEYAQTYYDRWMASAQRYSDLMAIEKRILESSLNIIDIKEKSYNSTISTSTSSASTTTSSGGLLSDRYNYEKTYSPYTPTTVVTSTVSPTPTTPTPPPPPPPPVKTAPLDTILYEEDPIPIEIMADLIFENIGGQELINISRNDLINGQKIIYQPIKNLNSIQQEYNPNNIIALQNTSLQIFNGYSIKIENKTPNVGNGPDGSFVYIEPETGDLIIEAINLRNDEQIEVQIIQGGTIYEAEL